MTTYVWAALAVAVVAIVAPGVFALSRGLAAWRDYRRFRRRSYDVTNELQKRLIKLERAAAKTERHSTRLQHARAELAASVAEARILAAAFAEVQATVNQVKDLIPHK